MLSNIRRYEYNKKILYFDPGDRLSGFMRGEGGTDSVSGCECAQYIRLMEAGAVERCGTE
jgi:hypothetical protein